MFLIFLVGALGFNAERAHARQDTLELGELAQMQRDRYLNPLSLEGRSASSALNLLFSKGFRCGLSERPLFPDRAPTLDCIFDAGFSTEARCPVFVTTIFLDWPSYEKKTDAKFIGLSLAKVRRVGTALCILDPPLKIQGHKDKVGATEILASQLDVDKALGETVGHLRESLFDSGFFCSQKGEGGRGSEQSMICTRFPSKIADCDQETIFYSLESSATPRAKALSAKDVDSKRVSSGRVECTTPGMSLTGR